MPRYRFLIVTLAALASFAAPEARAAESPWLDVEGDVACLPTVAELRERIASAVVGARNTELAVQVKWLEEEHQTVAIVRLLAGMRVSGEKRLETPTCEQTLDAVVAVVALALSSDSTEPAKLGREASLNGVLANGELPQASRLDVEPASTPLRWQASTLPELDRGVQERAEQDSAFDAFGAAGVDRGTFGEAGGLVGAGGGWVQGRAQLRSALWYGLTRRKEEVTDETYYRENADFGALTLDYCHGIDAGRWLSACGGLEVGWVRLERLERKASGLGVEHFRSSPSLAPSVGTLMALRSGPIHPELSLFALFPVFGRAPEAELLAMRATLGASVPF